LVSNLKLSFGNSNGSVVCPTEVFPAREHTTRNPIETMTLLNIVFFLLFSL